MKIEEMIAANRADCSGCSACANICPKNAITMTRDAEGFVYPKIDPELCIKCGKCDATCPSLNFKAKAAESLPQTFVATYENDKILRHSSSGAMFTALSEIILGNGGIVFGAGFDKNWRVAHTSAQNLDELENLRGSKYVQSQIGDVYRQVKEALKTRQVLFTGVPCQCAGLRHFLGGDHENLLTVDIVCHGSASPAVWESYIDELGYAHDITHVNFRSKRNGWGPTVFEVNFADRGHKISKILDNPYGKFFMRNVSLRPSCANCKAKFPNNHSDLTLGDAWGVEIFAPEMFDKRGVSIVFLHTEKGREIFERLTLKKKQVTFGAATEKNKIFLGSIVAEARREKFFAELAGSNDWFSVMKKYFTEDDTEFRKEVSKKVSAGLQKNFREILASVRQKFKNRILVVSSIRDKEGQEFLMKFFEQSVKDSIVYYLQPKDAEKFLCTESFSGAKFELKDTAALTNFLTDYDIKLVCVEKPLNFGNNSPTVVEWLKGCKLPVKLFAQKAQ